MALKKKPVTGMKDILPKEMEIRNYVMNMIRETYGTFGIFIYRDTMCGAYWKIFPVNRAERMRNLFSRS